jgi:hypothetical protein
MSHTRFRVPVATALSINYTRLKPKIISAQQLTCYFTLYENITSRKVAYFSKTYYHTSLQDPKVVRVVLPPHKFGCLPLQKIKNCSIGYPLFVCNLYEVSLKFIKCSGIEMQNTDRMVIS